MNFKKIISLLTVFTIIFSLLAPLQSSANDFTGENNETNLNFESFIEYNEDATNGFLESDLVFDSNEIIVEPMCGPPCAMIAVTVVKEGGKALLKSGLRLIKTVTPATAGAASRAVANYVPKTVTIGKETYTITARNMQHYLERHSMKHWNGTWEYNQDFFHTGMTLNRLETIATSGVKANASKIANSTSDFVTIDYMYEGIGYRIGVNKATKRIEQLYPRATFVNPNNP
ncbi:hypothetical protein R6U77_03270 [Lysinibacillus louembei]|uniref:Uncharacterized protein n=1 Tax=Lysinibacillus louembei TaxID=1470088 RepID=A0ABZ0S4Q2_9BACI|nr:hypothetical protein [Lysinibacillus louembei]WPK12737.1 hypothetical protein R6U77_03270 [Lysinibacillus louembei]